MTLSEPQFIIQSKNWIFHKLILAEKSGAYKADETRRNAIRRIRDVFTAFLKFPNTYSAGQIALLIKRNEGLLETILPIPANPSYQNSLVVLHKIIEAAEQIIKEYNLSL